MTQPLPETGSGQQAEPDNAWARASADFQQSLADGLTETFEAYCARISKETSA